ncbi:MAG: DUF294 nucleotidyltransferase-like domain-containing protein [Cytophagales bacterium]|nr:DUF294 nucleotidyltransferase-like domain-containing protein [Cytophagales bacterium]
MGNVITDRVAFFLKDFHPFSFLDQEDLEGLASNITVKFLTTGETLYREGASFKEEIYVLRQGNVKLLKQEESSIRLVDQCEPGDVFGVRAFFIGKTYELTAECAEESLVYAISKKTFQVLLEHNASFSLFFAKGYASGQVIVRGEYQQETSPLMKARFDNQRLLYSRDVLTCQPSDSIQKAAQLMTDRNVGSIIVADADRRPLGILTDTDLRKKVVSKGIPIDQPISEIMSSPVFTAHAGLTLPEALGAMIKKRLNHIVITEDGQNDSPISGILSDRDVLVSQKNHPAALIKSIHNSNEVQKWADARNAAEALLKEYLEQEVSISLVANLITSINDVIIEKALDKAIEETPEAEKHSFSWLNLGSEGREEQLLRTDQDNALVFADTENNDSTREIMVQVTSKVTEMLDMCGFEKCPADMMASNPKYCLSLSECKNLFSKWINVPDPASIMNATIFFDFRAMYGSRSLGEEVHEHLRRELKPGSLFFHNLAKNALQNPPPLSFFKNFLVEQSGEHRSEFDIKKRAMMPISDAARLLCLSHGMVDIQNTAERFHALAEREPNNQKLFDEAAAAYEIMMRYRAMNGLHNSDNGRYIQLTELNKLEKQMIKNAFIPIKDLQELISVRFQANAFD